MSAADTNPKCWVQVNGSGSLRRAQEEGMTWREMYLHERAAFEICTAAEIQHRSRVLTGPGLAEPDCPATTETCWYARVLRWRLSQRGLNVHVEVNYLNIEGSSVREGLGLVFRTGAFSWVPKGRIIVAMVAEYKPGKGNKPGRWLNARNPC